MDIPISLMIDDAPLELIVATVFDCSAVDIKWGTASCSWLEDARASKYDVPILSQRRVFEEVLRLGVLVGVQVQAVFRSDLPLDGRISAYATRAGYDLVITPTSVTLWSDAFASFIEFLRRHCDAISAKFDGTRLARIGVENSGPGEWNAQMASGTCSSVDEVARVYSDWRSSLGRL